MTRHIVPSTSRTSAAGKYLLTQAKVLADTRDEKKTTKPQRNPLHALYVVNDLLHWHKYHQRSPDIGSLEGAFGESVEVLVACASSFELKGNKGLHQGIDDLLKIWEENAYFSAALQQRLAEASQERQQGRLYAGEDLQSAAVNPSTAGSEAPWIMPDTHGHPTAPFYDLPAANMIPHIIPNSSSPINAQFMRALQLPRGAVDTQLVSVVQDFLKDVETIYTPDYESHLEMDVDEMGQLMVFDELGERAGDSYYGWSRAFAQRMTKKRQEGQSRGRSRSRETSPSNRSRSRSLRKRRRSYSSSRSRSRSRGRLGARSRSPSSSAASRSHRRPRSPSSRSPPRHRPRHGGSRSPPRSPPPPGSRHVSNQQRRGPSAEMHHHQLPPRPQAAFGAPAPFAGAAPPIAFDGGGMPIPPPRPVGWTGVWPPPPPPPMAFAGGGFNPAVVAPPGFVPPPPPGFVPGMQMPNFPAGMLPRVQQGQHEPPQNGRGWDNGAFKRGRGR